MCLFFSEEEYTHLKNEKTRCGTPEGSNGECKTRQNKKNQKKKKKKKKSEVDSANASGTQALKKKQSLKEKINLTRLVTKTKAKLLLFFLPMHI